MVFRVLGGLFHVGFASWLALTGVLLVVQARLNSQWEIGFYGDHAGASTWFMLVAGIGGLSMAAAEASIGGAFSYGARGSGFAMFALSVVMLFLVPWPFTALMAFTGALGLWELLPSRIPGLEEDDDEE
jgi:hypothetical protein